jgi:spermidine/putrescine transport system substrate-binding protein
MDEPLEKNELVDKLCEGKLDRRAFSKTMLSLGVAMTALPLTSKFARAAETPIDDDLVVYEWSGYELPEFHQAYIDKHGKTPAFTFFGEEEEAMQKMRAGFKADISHPCTYSTRRWRDAGLLKPIDTSRLAHWNDMFPNLHDLPGSRDAEGKNYFLAWDWGNSSVLYRTDLVDPAYVQEESWNILFDERYEGRLATYDSVDGVLGVVGLVVGAKDPFNMTDAEFERAAEKLRLQRKLMRFYWTDTTAIEQALASGELVASYAWNSSYQNLKKEGVPVAYMKPKEGIYTWVCGFALLANGEGDEDKAYDYLNAVLAPEAGEYLVTAYGYGHCNQKTYDRVPAETLAELGITDPKTHMADGVFFAEIEPKVREKYITLFEEIKAGF